MIILTIKRNPDSFLADAVEEALEKIKEKYGKKYCPCNIEMSDDTICMCKTFREQAVPGECPCGRYIKVEE